MFLIFDCMKHTEMLTVLLVSKIKTKGSKLKITAVLKIAIAN